MFFGVRYLTTTEFMPYHAVVAGKSWAQLEPGVQTVIVGMLTIIGGCFISFGCAVLWLLVPLNRGEDWARWALLTMTAACVVPTLYVTITLRRFAPQAETPVVPAALALALMVVGVGLSFLPVCQNRKALA
jgi:cytochrome bd-type quinol oxidase subunit 2